MTDKEKILAEIERLYNRAERHVTLESEGLKAGDTRTYEDGLADAYDIMHNFINSQPEEPVSEDLEAEIVYLSKQFPEVSFAKLSRIAVRVAKWQKEKVADVVKQYSDKGEKNYQDTLDNYDEGERSNEFYWDGYRDCAKGIKRELED